MLDLYNRESFEQELSLLEDEGHNKFFKLAFKYLPNRKVDNIFKKDRERFSASLIRP